MRKKKRLLDYAFYTVIIYLVLAFSWWTVLLNLKNEDAFNAKVEYLFLVQVAQSNMDRNTFENTKEYLDLKWQYEKGQLMIYSEALFFVISLFGGIYFMNKGYFDELRNERQRQNFMLSITHELKSPIASVKLALQTMQKRTLPPDKSTQLTQLALKENQRLGQLVENILLAARIEADYELDTSEQPLNSILQDVADDFMTKYEFLQLDLSLENNLPLVTIDKTSMVSVFTNLIENAIKYSNAEPLVHVKTFQFKDKVIVEVQDQGIGIPEIEKKKIFDRFYRVGREETRSTKGTGLGLYLVRELVRLHKGKIRVLDNEPTGSIFKIELPVA